MLITIQYFCAHHKEIDAICSFLDWQCKRYSLVGVGTPELVKKTKGKGGVLVTINDTEVLGLKGVIEYWEQEGLWNI